MQGREPNRVQGFESWLAEGLCPGVPATSAPLPDPGETGAEQDYTTSAFNEDSRTVDVIQDNGDIYRFDPSIESLLDEDDNTF